MTETTTFQRRLAERDERATKQQGDRFMEVAFQMLDLIANANDHSRDIPDDDIRAMREIATRLLQRVEHRDAVTALAWDDTALTPAQQDDYAIKLGAEYDDAEAIRHVRESGDAVLQRRLEEATEVFNADFD